MTFKDMITTWICKDKQDVRVTVYLTNGEQRYGRLFEYSDDWIALSMNSSVPDKYEPYVLFSDDPALPYYGPKVLSWKQIETQSFIPLHSIVEIKAEV